MPILVEVRRGNIVESRHRGVVVVSEPDGKIIALAGDPDYITSTRSTIKPFQAIPLITSGAADRFDITSRELAVACASHNGEPIHTETAARILERAGLSESALLCGAHRPYSEEAAKKIECEGGSFTQLHNNCSGKHAGMLMTAVHRELSTAGYVSIEHPVQRAIVSAFARAAGLGEDLPAGIDGCSAPTFGVPLRALALGFARLAGAGAAGGELDSDTAEAAKRIVEAMILNPEMIGGDGEFDTEVMREAHGKLIAKVGAESVYSVGVLPCERYPRGLGIAIKIDDGAKRAVSPAVLETLAQLQVLDESELERLHGFHHPLTRSYRDIPVGDIRAVFKLEIGRATP
jgi:L-asparaginase II